MALVVLLIQQRREKPLRAVCRVTANLCRSKPHTAWNSKTGSMCTKRPSSPSSNASRTSSTRPARPARSAEESYQFSREVSAQPVYHPPQEETWLYEVEPRSPRLLNVMNKAVEFEIKRRAIEEAERVADHYSSRLAHDYTCFKNFVLVMRYLSRSVRAGGTAVRLKLKCKANILVPLLVWYELSIISGSRIKPFVLLVGKNRFGHKRVSGRVLLQFRKADKFHPDETLEKMFAEFAKHEKIVAWQKRAFPIQTSHELWAEYGGIP